MACEFPGAHSPEELWQNVLAGRRFFRKAPPERLPPEYFDPDPDAPGKSYCDQMAVLTDWVFDPVEFHIPPVTFQVTDMAHWLALYTARSAIRNAGLKLDSINRAHVGVVLGNSLTGEFSRSHNLRFRWPYVERSIRRALARGGMPEAQLQELLDSVQRVYEAPLPEITEDTLAGNMSNTIAGRICNHFNFGAGGFTVDGACSSSLLSVATACNALANGEMDFALAGGVDVSLDPFEMVGFAKTRALAADDIRPYDEHAAGMLTGEGCGIVVLAREEDARAAGYPIHALIRGWGYSSDGAGGITAPEVEGQMRALRHAYERAGYSISTVGLIEGHGTGTSLGDQVELTALRRLLDESPGDICRIGSLKANIGHCKAAAGIAGLIKAVMALERKIIPPTVNCESPNPAFGLPLGRLRPSMEGLAWSCSPMPRRASVSAMGFGGANAHITLEEVNPEAVPSPADLSLLGSRQTSELIVLAAGETGGLRHQIEKYLPVVRRLCRAEMTDLSAALAKSPASGKLRLAIVALSPWNLAEQLKRCAEKLAGGAEMAALDDPANGVFAGVALDDPKLVALFPGQGSQRLNMGRHWLGRFPFVREFYERVSQAGDETSVLGSISRHIFRDRFSANEETREAWEKELRETCIAQPAIVLSSMATLQVLQFLGLQPRIVIGHSLGEISALAAAGAWDALTAVRLAAVRGQAMGSLRPADGGSMAAVAAKPGQVGGLLKPLGSALVISNYNSPRQTVVSGGSEAIQKLVHVCEGQGISCRHIAVSHAFHSDLVAPAADIFREMAGGMDIPRRAPGVPTGAVAVISTVTGSLISAEDAGLDYLAGQIRRPVRFTDAVLKAVGTQPSLWIEVGPGGALTAFVRDILSGFNVHCLATDLANEDGFHLLNQALARAWVLGFPVKLERLFTHRFHRLLDVDHYAPRFIVNPCERVVADSSVAADAGGLAKAEGKPEVPGPTERAAPVADRDSLLAFAIEWIARRTGFPKSAISPEKKLRDDLNLDSIKVGELVVLLTKKLGRRFDADPASVANSRISDLVEAVLSQTQNGGAGTDEAASRRVRLGPADGLAGWTRTFHMEFVSAPPTDSARLPLPTAGACVIVAEPDSSRARAIADRLRCLGLAPAVMDVDSLLKRGEAPPDLAALILLLPEMKKPFLSCGPEEFDRRVEGTATTLFRVFRWAGHSRAGAELRGLVLRAANGAGDCGCDLDGGSGFLKSLGLEYPAANFKWLTLPAEWLPERWAEAAVQELQTGRDRVAFTYTPDGQRLSEAATLTPSPAILSHPTAEGRGAGTVGLLGPDDVVLVSGGAKGITCELALALAQKTNAKLALIGSSPLPDASADPQGNEVLRNLLRFQKLGLRHLYLQADVTDLAAVQEAVHEAERLLGPVTAILHGAGVTFLRLFRDKELDEFLRCVRIKARGLYNLLAAVPPARLKALHVISSVLGKTGMRGQADYALANAWLDGAVRSVKAAHPRVHCLSLGYTAWAETGLARRVGALDSLRSIGVTPVSVQEGIAAYLELVQTPQWDGNFVITGRLTSDLEANLHAPAARPQGRFLEQLHRRVPGVELVAEATLSHATDLYLPEHVFEGTPMFPGVMAIEAMVQAAMACVDRTEWPVLRNVQFHTPLIVPGDAKTVMRTLALADVPNDGAVRVRVAIRSERDGFKQNHFAAECWFEKERNNSRSPGFPLPESLPEPLNKDPEEFSPVPLFQGKFFRRITAIRKMTMGEESLTEIQVPVGEQYFRHIPDDAPATPSPVVRDACLQSGALILPPGCLPSRLEELHFLGRALPEEKVVCSARVRSKSPDEFVVDIAVFDSGGKPLELMKGLRLKQTGTGVTARQRQAPSPIGPARVPGDLQALLPKMPHAIALVDHEELKESVKLNELSTGELERLKAEIALPRQVSAMANLVATRRAALAYGRRMQALPAEGSTAHRVGLAHRADGKPELRFADESVAKVFQGADISLADGNGFSVAWIGPAPAGIDIESVEKRDTESWRGLLGDDGYALALRVSAQTAEPFDLAATRVWTLLEAGRKANGLKRILPGYESSLGGPWLCFADTTDNGELELLSVALAMPQSQHPTCGQAGTAVLTVAVGRALAEPPCPSELARTGWSTSFEALLADFRAGMERLKILCAKDPQSPGAEARHAEFISVIEKTSQRLKPLEKAAGAVDLMAMRGQFQKTVLEYLEGSENFRHTLVKPFGYAGDFQLLEMLAGNTCTSRGLAYHFDQSQLEYPASAACRRRIEWISGELSDRMERRKAQSLSILDLGIGTAPIEQRLLRQHPEILLLVHAVDLEPAALEYVHRVLAGGNCTVYPWRLNLRDPAAMTKVSELAAQADAVIAIGILEALTDAEAVRLLQTALRSLPMDGVFYTENFVPTHPTRSVMEWFQDFHLAYRSLDELKTLALQAGADPSCLELKLDSTGSLALLKMTK